MTDAPDPQHHLDELASAHLDGQTSAAEAARVAADGDLQARVAALRSARDAVAGPTATADPARREAAIAAALAAFDAEPAPTSTAVVADLDARRRQRRRLQLLGAAAAVVVAAVAIPLLAGLDDTTDDQVAVEATAEDLRADDAGGTATEDAVASTTVPAPEVAGPLSGYDAESAAGGLGSFDDLDQLVAAARSEAARERSGEAADSAPPACDGTPEVPAEATRLLLTTAVLDGTDVVVIAYDDGGLRRLVVQDASTCATLAVVDL